MEAGHSTNPSALPLPPGPPWWRIHEAFRTSPPDYILGLIREYGDVVRFRGAFPVYCINHPEYVRQILTRAWPQYTKNTIDYRVIASTLGRGLVTNDGPDWARQRRLMQPMFANRRIDTFDTVINEMTEALARDWAGRAPGATVWLEKDMSRVTFQVVSRTLFGADIDDAADEMTGILEVLNQHPMALSALLTLWPWLPVPSNRRFKRVKQRLDTIVDGLVDLHRRGGGTPDDIVHRLLAARDDETGEGMDDGQMRDEIITLMLAGHETSATALTWTFWQLAQYPEVEQRLVAELDAALGGAPARAADLARLPYLKQVVQESMRLYPPVWGIARRATEEVEFGGYRIPAGSYLSITMYSLHRHPEFWPDPERFDPERFAPGRNESRHSYAYLPFAAGPRTCIGAGMAMLEIQLVLALLLQRFRVTPLAGHPVVPLPVVTYKPRYGLPVTLAPR
ncbi:MAG: cytochrome P450 [Gammaproteobacteria bacterium]|nr:cytochrome P450 [Gammaproteobacteria bacterium]